MRRIETNSQALRLLYMLDNLRQLFQLASQTTALPRGNLQAGNDAVRFDHVVNHIQRSDDFRNPRLFTRTHVRAGVRHQIRNPKLLAPPQLFDSPLDTLPPELLVGCGEIDQITVVADGSLELQSLLMGFPFINHERI